MNMGQKKKFSFTALNKHPASYSVGNAVSCRLVLTVFRDVQNNLVKKGIS